MNPSTVLPLLLLATTLVNNATATIPVVDTLAEGVQFRQATFFLNIGATDIALTAYKVQECDTFAGSYTDCADTVYGSGGRPALPTAASDNKFFPITVTGRKRYLKLVVTVGNGTTGASLTCFCVLGNAVASNLTTLLAIARGLDGQEIIA